MIKAAIDRIIELGKPVTTDINGQKYTRETIQLVGHPSPKPLQLNTLTGLIEFIHNEYIPSDLKTIIHILNESQVEVISDLLNDTQQRHKYAIATPPGNIFEFGQWHDTETFIIGLQADFEDTEDKKSVLKLAGNLKELVEKTHKDDGFTQQAAASTGITSVEKVPVPNPVKLQPFRTFREVDQPESRFVFRIRQSPHGPECALFEADGQRWKLEAIQKIRAWLKSRELTANIVVIA